MEKYEAQRLRTKKKGNPANDIAAIGLAGVTAIFAGSAVSEIKRQLFDDPAQPKRRAAAAEAYEQRFNTHFPHLQTEFTTRDGKKYGDTKPKAKKERGR